MDAKPLQPLTHGNVLIVGVKASNFDDELRNHPRVIMWDSQNEHWSDKDIPANVRAIFVTRWIGHAAFGKILKEARAKKITMFNPEGTGAIARQVKELLFVPLAKPTFPEFQVQAERVYRPEPESVIQPTTIEETTVVKEKQKKNKLAALVPLIDFSKSNAENADILLAKGKELGITTTRATLADMVYKHRKRQGKKGTYKVKDVSIDILDNVINELKDVREYLASTIEENVKLKQKLDKFKKFFED